MPFYIQIFCPLFLFLIIIWASFFWEKFLFKYFYKKVKKLNLCETDEINVLICLYVDLYYQVNYETVTIKYGLFSGDPQFSMLKSEIERKFDWFDGDKKKFNEALGLMWYSKKNVLSNKKVLKKYFWITEDNWHVAKSLSNKYIIFIFVFILLGFTCFWLFLVFAFKYLK